MGAPERTMPDTDQTPQSRVAPLRLLHRQDLPRPAVGCADTTVAHTLIVEFGRPLSDREWRTVITAARRLPYVRRLRVDVVPAGQAAAWPGGRP
jgi:hypothetical protein